MSTRKSHPVVKAVAAIIRAKASLESAVDAYTTASPDVEHIFKCLGDAQGYLDAARRHTILLPHPKP